MKYRPPSEAPEFTPLILKIDPAPGMRQDRPYLIGELQRYSGPAHWAFDGGGSLPSDSPRVLGWSPIPEDEP